MNEKHWTEAPSQTAANEGGYDAGLKYPDVTVKLVGEDGNAFAIMGAVGNALQCADVPAAEIAEFHAEATSGDYDHLLRTAMAWVVVE